MKKAMALMALTILTACDYAVRKDIRSERDDRLYREAMDDYRSGKMDAAISGFEKAVRKDPSNASARFQLACLQQDVRKDYVSAFCGYREFLLQQPESDRARLAADRMAVCEKEMAAKLSSKHGFNTAEGFAKRLADAQAELKQLKDRVALAEKNLGVSQERVRSLSAERDRLLAAVKAVGEDRSESSDMKEVLKEKQALEHEDAAPTDAMQSVRSEKQLLEAEEEDETSSGSSLLPARKPEDLVKSVDEQPAKKAEEKKVPDHPKTYVVQEGDTLYGVAKKFYGSILPWKQIRDANKALISADNRLKAGDTIVLP